MNPGLVPRLRILGRLTQQLAVFLRRYGAYRFLTFSKDSSLIKSVLFRRASVTDNRLTTTELQLVNAIASEGVIYVEKKLDRNLQDWKL